MPSPVPIAGERWQRVKAILQDALEQQPASRAAFLAQISLDDTGLAQEVGSLLEAHDQAGSFIDTPVLARRDVVPVFEDLQETPKWAGRRIGP